MNQKYVSLIKDMYGVNPEYEFLHHKDPSYPEYPSYNKYICINVAFHDCKKRARKRKLEFGLSLPEFISFVLKPCHYCGQFDIKIKTPNGISPEKFCFNGVDRVDSSIGYITPNCVPCCSQCNYMKLDYSQREFKLKIKQIYKTYAKSPL